MSPAGFSEHQTRFLADIVNRLPVAGSTILEVGCRDGALSRRLVSVGARRVVGVDPDLASPVREGPLELLRVDPVSFSPGEMRFDLAVSLSTLETSPDPAATLAAVHSLLRPGGTFYTRFGPIWTYAIGHHYQVWDPEPTVAIPLWGHLYFTEEDMEVFLRASYGPEAARKATDYVYRSRAINRLGHGDYRRILSSTPFRTAEVTPLVNALLSPFLRTKRKLLRHYGEEELLVFGFVALFRK